MVPPSSPAPRPSRAGGLRPALTPTAGGAVQQQSGAGRFKIKSQQIRSLRFQWIAAVRAGGLGVAGGKAEVLFVGPRGEEGQGCKGEPSLVRFRLWRMGTSEAAWQVPYLADLPKVLLRNATRFASVTTVNPPPSSQFLVTVILWSRR